VPSKEARARRREEKRGEGEALGMGDVRIEKFFEICKFKDACFPPRYDGRIKIKVSSSNIKPPTAQKIS